MRLIDADELIEGRVENDPVVIAANCQPTAYDVDEVIRDLEIRKELLEYAHISKSAKTAAGQAYTIAIDLVKDGGVYE